MPKWVLLLVMTTPLVSYAALYDVEKRLWRPQADSVYLQESGKRIKTDEPITAVAKFKGEVYVVMDGAAHVLMDKEFHPAPAAPQDIRHLETLNGALWATAESGPYRYDGAELIKVDSRCFRDMCVHRGEVHGATANDILLRERRHGLAQTRGRIPLSKPHKHHDGWHASVAGTGRVGRAAPTRLV